MEGYFAWLTNPIGRISHVEKFDDGAVAIAAHGNCNLVAVHYGNKIYTLCDRADIVIGVSFSEGYEYKFYADPRGTFWNYLTSVSREDPRGIIVALLPQPIAEEIVPHIAHLRDLMPPTNIAGELCDEVAVNIVQIAE